jgi:hypothetical protein
MALPGTRRVLGWTVARVRRAVVGAGSRKFRRSEIETLAERLNAGLITADDLFFDRARQSHPRVRLLTSLT